MKKISKAIAAMAVAMGLFGTTGVAQAQDYASVKANLDWVGGDHGFDDAKGIAYQLYINWAFNDHSNPCFLNQQYCMSELGIAGLRDLGIPYEVVFAGRASLMRYAAVVAKCNPTLAYKAVLLALWDSFPARQSLIDAGQDLVLAYLAVRTHAIQLQPCVTPCGNWNCLSSVEGHLPQQVTVR